MAEDFDPDRFTFGKMLFMHFGKIPHALFVVAHFFVTLPLRLMRISARKKMPKHVRLHRLSDTPVTALEAFRLVRELRENDKQEELPLRPTIFQMLYALWGEWEKPIWRIPAVSELVLIREELVRDLAMLPCGEYHARRSYLWAHKDTTRAFVGYCPFDGHDSDDDAEDGPQEQERYASVTAAKPKEYLSALAKRAAPDSEEKYLAYAVLVTIEDDPAT